MQWKQVFFRSSHSLITFAAIAHWLHSTLSGNSVLTNATSYSCTNRAEVSFFNTLDISVERVTFTSLIVWRHNVKCRIFHWYWIVITSISFPGNKLLHNRVMQVRNEVKRYNTCYFRIMIFSTWASAILASICSLSVLFEKSSSSSSSVLLPSWPVGGAAVTSPEILFDWSCCDWNDRN